MEILKKIAKAVRSPRKIMIYLMSQHNELFSWISDESYVKFEYYVRMGKKLNLENPKTYNEKLQWLKLYNRVPLYTELVDKAAVKNYVADKIGKEYIIPTIDVWKTAEEVDFKLLPDQFVLKVTHDSGGLVICKNKASLDQEQARKKLMKALKTNYYKVHREWPYKNVTPRIIAEKYLEDSSTTELRDYKFFVFNGKVKAMFVASERQKKDEETKFDFFDENYNSLQIVNGHPNSRVLPKKPLSFEKMKMFAEILGEGMPHVRIDFYEVDGKPYFGEMTFFHWSGMTPFEPEKWDRIFGSYLTLPKEKR